MMTVSTVRCSRRRRRCLLITLASMVVILLLNASFSLLFIHWRMPVIVSFDMKGTLDSFMNQASAKKLNEEESASLSVRFSDSLHASLSDWQQKHQALILVRAGVVGGAADITAVIQQDVARRMQAGSAQ
jgi:conjugal transfer pilin signal peptidase TrbI